MGFFSDMRDKMQGYELVGDYEGRLDGRMGRWFIYSQTGSRDFYVCPEYGKYKSIFPYDQVEDFELVDQTENLNVYKIILKDGKGRLRMARYCVYRLLERF